MIAAVIAAPLLSAHDPTATALQDVLQPPAQFISWAQINLVGTSGPDCSMAGVFLMVGAAAVLCRWRSACSTGR
jgi:hypothetical protein